MIPWISFYYPLVLIGVGCAISVSASLFFLLVARKGYGRNVEAISPLPAEPVQVIDPATGDFKTITVHPDFKVIRDPFPTIYR